MNAPLARALLLLASVLALAAGLVAPGAAQDTGRPAADGSIRQQDLQHDSRDDRYRTPGGAVPAGTSVKLRLRAAAGDLSGAQARFTDRASGESWAVPMERVASDPAGGDFGHDYWQVEVETLPRPMILDYTFVAQDGQSSRHLFDDRAMDGGTGQVGRQAPPDRGWQLTFYDPEFETPDWAPGSVVYQIFPDRFANGDPGNDPSPAATPGTDGATRYRHGDVYGNDILPLPWDARPEGHCRAYQGSVCDSGPLGRDFFGGDLAGITAELDNLADLGVTVIYLSPIFAAPTNHRYDTSDYSVIDPDLGTLEEFDALLEGARTRGIRIVLDGVFNHVSSDSPWFDRMRRYAEEGACESADSLYRSWFTFRDPGPGEPEPCAASSGEGTDTYYVGWFGFDTIPELREIGQVNELFVGPDGVVRQWLERGTAGWRLDVADSMSHEFQAAIRDATKETSPDAIVIAEQWQDSTPWLLGDQADSTMNYRFRRAVIGLINGDTADPDGSIEGLTPSGFASAMLGVKEDYPEPAYRVLMNLVDSHDTSRILWTLTPGIDNDEAKSEPMALAEGKAKLRLLSTIQLTFPGMASIYYGDEVGLSGHDDPDDRRPYPWGAEDMELRDHYRTLARLRADHEAMREGDLEFLLTGDGAATLAYLRRSENAAAIVALNLGDRERTLEIDTSGGILRDGLELSDVLGRQAPISTSNGQVRVTLAPMSAVVLVSGEEANLAAPPAPTGLSAIAADSVSVTWDPVPGVESYQVRRSLLGGGGYDVIAATAESGFVDRGARPGVAHFYVITAVDEHGNVSQWSDEVVALSRVGISGVDLVRLDRSNDDSPLKAVVALSAVDGSVGVEVAVTAESLPEDTADGALVEVGLSLPGLSPREASASTADSWAWSSAEVMAIGDATSWFSGWVQPEASGTYLIGTRASDDGGQTWLYGLTLATLEVTPALDAVAPPAPSAPELLDVSGDRVRIRWGAPVVEDLYRYLVLRADATGGPYEVIATTIDPVFADTTVSSGTAYLYAVQAQDNSFNTSALSEPTSVVARERVVGVTFTVTAPANTAPTDTLFIAGGFQGWDPAGTPMTRVDDTTWSITLEFDDQGSLEYKYTRGSWEAVEKDAGCGEIPNRTLVVTHGTDGSQEIHDAVAKWRDLDGCG